MTSGGIATFYQPGCDGSVSATSKSQSPILSDVDIEIKGLCKTFSGKQAVLQNINLSILHGQAVALIGHNGSGKSTLLRCCLNLVEPTNGTIRLLGCDITSLKGESLRCMRSKVGFIFQRHNLVPRLSVLTNVLHGVQARKKGPKTWLHCLAAQKDREEAMAHLNRVGLAHLASRRVDRLSGGESQRVAIARALMQRPSIMMADEPVASLDPNAGEEVMQLFLDLIKDDGITLLFVSHNLEHALKYADRIVGLRKGCLKLDTPSKAKSATSLRCLYNNE
jgi:phosphonate transport system ATP-binding protein